MFDFEISLREKMKAAIREKKQCTKNGGKKKGKTGNQDNLTFLSGRKLIRGGKCIIEKSG